MQWLHFYTLNFVTVSHFFYNLIFFEELKTSVEACFLHNRIFINSLASSYKENKITEHLFNKR